MLHLKNDNCTMKTRLLYILTFCISVVYAQKAEREINYLDLNITVEKLYFNETSAYTAKEEITFLSKNVLTDERLELILTDEIKGKESLHRTYTISLNGLNVYNAFLKTSYYRKTNKLIVVKTNVYLPQFASLNSSNTTSLESIFFADNQDSVYTEQVIIPSTDPFIATRSLVTYNGGGLREFLINNNEIFYQRDLNSYHTTTQDSTCNFLVFNPDPISPIYKSYGGIYIDDNDQNQSVLDPLRDTVQEMAFYNSNAGYFELKNDFVSIEEFSNPVHLPPTSTTGNFFFSRYEPEFEQVNAFYHITKYQRFVQSLGFTNLANFPIRVDANAMNGSDNSMFQPSPQPSLFFGEGGVDDAEDADVIIHEYGHALSYSAAPGTNNGTERSTLDEALGDYLAASYSKLIVPFKWYNIFSWDGHNPFFDGRSGVAPNKNYKNITFNNGIYEHTNLWVNALMDIEDIYGVGITHTLLFESLYGYYSFMTYTDAALLMVEADSNLYNGTHVTAMWNVFYNWGILPSNAVSLNENVFEGIEINGTSEFAKGGELIVINPKASNMTVALVDLTGKTLYTKSIAGAYKQFISSQNLNAGVYILLITGENSSQLNTKLVKY